MDTELDGALAATGAPPAVGSATGETRAGRRLWDDLRREVGKAVVGVDEPLRLVLVASRGGDDRQPGWYLNLVARPEVEVTRRGARTAMVARTATPEERAELWPRVVAAYAGYAEYQRRTAREIPLVICTPRS